ncbi:MAG: TIM barrel protein [Alphaproteobacteria bacterium]
MTDQANNWPKLHNATWPGVVGKGPDADEPFIDLDTMLHMTAKAEVGGVKFDGFDMFLSAPHFDIDSGDAEIAALVDKARGLDLEIGTVIAPVWEPTGGGSAMGSAEEVQHFLTQVRKACAIAQKIRAHGIRPNGGVRIDSSGSVAQWAEDPEAMTKKIAGVFDQACDIAAEHGEILVAEGEICWGGMHSWKEMQKLLEAVNRPQVLGFQADMAHTMLYLLGYNAPDDRILPANFDWRDDAVLAEAFKTLAAALRPWTRDLHIAQNDGTVKGSGSHDVTGRHCTVDDPNGKLDITRDAGYWLRDENGKITKRIRHLCWDGCMFPNETMMKQETWNGILGAMIKVREAHGWRE